MSKESFEKTLHYVSPSHGGWGVIRIAALIPESYQLFVAPFACGRHGALGGILNGVKDRISYLYIQEEDIVSGSYEDLIPDAVGELLENLDVKPKVILIFVSCLDDLLGTDHESLNDILSKRYHGISFRSCHMNPISSDTQSPPGVTLQNNIYSLLKKGKNKNKSVNFIGNNLAISKTCEIFEILNSHNFKSRHISDYKSFDDFTDMGSSMLNLVLSPTAKTAAKNMKRSIGIDYLTSYVTYDPDEIKEFYEALSNKLSLSINTDEYYSNTIKKIKSTSEKLKNFTIAIDGQAVRKPFTLANMLLKYGFDVRLVMTSKVMPFEKEAYELLKNSEEDVLIYNSIHPDMVKRDNVNNKYLCIGFDCAYATRASRLVNLMEDQTMFGFDGCNRLMDMMLQASKEEVSLRKIIEDAGLII